MATITLTVKECDVPTCRRRKGVAKVSANLGLHKPDDPNHLRESRWIKEMCPRHAKQLKAMIIKKCGEPYEEHNVEQVYFGDKDELGNPVKKEHEDE